MTPLAQALRDALTEAPSDLTRAALMIARVESPDLDPDPTRRALDVLGDRAADRLARLADAPVRARLAALNDVVFGEARFAGNRGAYGDFRNSLLNVVVSRRLGIPISLAAVYLHVGRRAGIEMFGISFPSHFLVHVPADAGEDRQPAIVVDPFAGGQALDERGCRALLARNIGDTAPFDRRLLEPCTMPDIVVRMLVNLQQAYLDHRSIPQARAASDLILAVKPTALAARRDRGLAAYQMDDLPAALRDLEDYLRAKTWTDEDREERDAVQARVAAIQQRLAALN
ncbi:MAG TPA: transglutaminase-like domain-containing protein [Vicinamibacterales bacterium]|nr:transglutaminase-like domain-containing protein [Vicinamibacterales bacterium]